MMEMQKNLSNALQGELGENFCGVNRLLLKKKRIGPDIFCIRALE